jgi:hypothetical protein
LWLCVSVNEFRVLGIQTRFGEATFFSSLSVKANAIEPIGAPLKRHYLKRNPASWTRSKTLDGADQGAEFFGGPASLACES